MRWEEAGTPSYTRLMRLVPTAALLLALGLIPGALAAPRQPAYRSEIERWRAERDTSLRADDGWPTLVGLFWLQPGEQSIGSARDNAFVLPGSAPAHVGTFALDHERVTFRPAPTATVTCGTRAFAGGVLHDDRTKPPDTLSFGTYSMLVINRAGRLGIRVRDSAAEGRVHFRGERWFPIEERWRIDARWVPHVPPREARIPNVVGGEFQWINPGYASFEIDGREVRLEALFEGEARDELFFIFKDGTSGQETYPAGRFLYAALPRSGRVVLDFNKAHNPPCAFTPFATCPLPPPQNHVPVRIAAGAMTYEH